MVSYSNKSELQARSMRCFACEGVWGSRTLSLPGHVRQCGYLGPGRWTCSTLWGPCGSAGSPEASRIAPPRISPAPRRGTCSWGRGRLPSGWSSTPHSPRCPWCPHMSVLPCQQEECAYSLPHSNSFYIKRLNRTKHASIRQTGQ